MSILLYQNEILLSRPDIINYFVLIRIQIPTDPRLDIIGE